MLVEIAGTDLPLRAMDLVEGLPRLTGVFVVSIRATCLTRWPDGCSVRSQCHDFSAAVRPHYAAQAVARYFAEGPRHDADGTELWGVATGVRGGT